MKTLILGLGNPLLTDDAVGLHVARVLRERLGCRPDVEVDEDYHGGLRLMERMIGYDRAIVIDAMQSGAVPGSIRRMGPGEFPTQHSASAHDATLPTALRVGRRAGVPLPAPERIVIVGVEAEDVQTFGEACTPRVEAAVPVAAEDVLAELDS